MNLSLEGAGEHIVRTGDAPKVYDPVKVELNGNLDAPVRYFNARKDLIRNLGEYFDLRRTHVILHLAELFVRLVCDEASKFGSVITGYLRPAEHYVGLGINSGKTFSPEDLAGLLKRKLWLFADQAEGLRVIGELRNFKGEVKTDLQASKDDRGNVRNRFEVSVKSNVPVSVKMRMPLFAGQADVTFDVDINLEVRGNSVLCYLDSAWALQQMESTAIGLIREQGKVFEEAGITVIEVG